MSAYDRHWQCELCETWFVVPSLARDCEDRHLAEPKVLAPVSMIRDRKVS